VVDQRVVPAVRKTVVVLDADDVRDAARLCDLGGGRVADSQMPVTTLLLP